MPDKYRCSVCHSEWEKKANADACCSRLDPVELQLVKVLRELQKATEMADKMAIYPRFRQAGVIYSAVAKMAEDARIWADEALLAYIEAKYPGDEECWSAEHDATWHDGAQARIWHGRWKDKRSGKPPKPWPNKRSFQAALKRAKALRQQFGAEWQEEQDDAWVKAQTSQDYHVAKMGGWWGVYKGPFVSMYPGHGDAGVELLTYPDNPEKHSNGRAVFHRLYDAQRFIEVLRRRELNA